MSRACQNCQWWWQDPNRPDEGGSVGECRASLPVMKTSVRFPHDEADSQDGIWPQTVAGEWCAHFRETQASVICKGDRRPGAAMVSIEDNGLVTVVRHDGGTIELSSFDRLSDADKILLERMVWPA